jgi:inosine-uridine nucleoside N-ribohydrolase
LKGLVVNKRNVIIDCDTGVDDALALFLALRWPGFNVLGITNVAGNVPLQKVVRNTLVVVEHSGKDVPVYQGASCALKGISETAEYAHGSDGLGDVGFPDPKLVKNSEHAVDFLVRSFMEADEPIELITLGPLTNIALALLKEPLITQNIKSLVMMAGGIENGNSTAAAEFNIWADPEAADLVFRSAIPNKTIVPLEPNTQGGGIHLDDIAQLESAPTPWCSMASKLLRCQVERWKKYTNEERSPTPPDLTAMGVAIDPTIGQGELLPVCVETQGEHTRGMTLVDRRPFRHLRDGVMEPNVNVIFTVDNSKHRELVVSTLLD